VSASAVLDNHRQAAIAYRSSPRRPPGRPPAFEQRIADAHQAVVEAEVDLDETRERRAAAQEQVREIGAAYHPYHLETGQTQSVGDVSHRLETCWEKLNELAQEANLPDRCFKKLRKARRVTGELLATVGFFFATLQAKIEALNLAPEVEEVAYQYLIPAIYLDHVAEKTQDREQRGRLRQQVTALLASVDQVDGAMSRLSNDERQVLEQVAVECAGLFQRSSSCVEARNGQLALHHHARHRLTNRKLAALTAAHNYYIRRPDATTAAERFFGRSPSSLFDALLEKVPLPGRPAQKRPRPPKPPYLPRIAA
jgi:small-conductance mechanosensitive channel